MARVLILGGGFGGIATATTLADLTGDVHEIVLVDSRADFVMGLRKNWHVVGTSTLQEGTRSLELLSGRGIKVVEGHIEAIDPDTRTVKVNGEELVGDELVIALGAHLEPAAVPGLAEHGINVWSRQQSETARAALDQLQNGRVVIGIFGTPYSCPPGPYELALLVHDRVAGRNVTVDVFTPTPISLPVVGQEGSNRLLVTLLQRDIGLSTGKLVRTVTESSVQFVDGSEQPFDLLFAVPPHKVPPVLVAAGLAQPDGWVKVSPATLETSFAGIHAVGDCTVIPLSNGMALPKAGAFAQYEGEVVAQRIAQRLAGREPTATFAGEGVCFIEFGHGEAAAITGSFLADPPAVSLSDPSAQLMDDKFEFEMKRLKAWFGF